MSGVTAMMLGRGGAPVEIKDSTVSDLEASPTAASCSVTVNNDGSVSFSGNGSDAGYDWYVPGSGGTPGDNYEIKLDVDSGDSPTSGDSTGSWLALTSNRSWVWNTGAGPASLAAGCTLSLRLAGASSARDTGTLSVSADSVI